MGCPKRKKEQLERLIWRVLKPIRKFDEELAAEGSKLGDSLADVRVRFADCQHNADVDLTYDGAGYDYLSPNADYPTGYRHKIAEEAQKLGFHCEDHNSWSMGFYYER